MRNFEIAENARISRMLVFRAFPNQTMGSGEFQKHTSCISEAQKVEKSVFRGDKVTKSQKKASREQQAKAGHAQTNEATSKSVCIIWLIAGIAG